MYIGHGMEKERRKRGREEEGGIRQRKTGKGRAEVSKGRWSEERIDECHSRQPFVDRSCAQVLINGVHFTTFCDSMAILVSHGQSAAITRVCLLRVCNPGCLTRLSAERGFQRHGRYLGWPSAATICALRSLFDEAFGSRLWVACRR